MHISRDWRDGIFKQLDLLHELDEWDPIDEPTKTVSFVTFLRFILHHRPAKRPGLGITSTGNLIGAWTSGGDRLTLEFLPMDGIKWVLSVSEGQARETASGQTAVRRFAEVIAPYNLNRWFFPDG